MCTASRRLLVAALLTALAGCTPDPDSARGVAEGFLDEHYVTMNLKAALPYTTGLARHKVQEEIDLVAGEEIDGGTMRPNVSYDLEEERREGEERVTFLYAGTVKLKGGGSFGMSWLVNTRREDGAWRVSNFKELPAREP